MSPLEVWASASGDEGERCFVSSHARGNRAQLAPGQVRGSGTDQRPSVAQSLSPAPLSKRGKRLQGNEFAVAHNLPRGKIDIITIEITTGRFCRATVREVSALRRTITPHQAAPQRVNANRNLHDSSFPKPGRYRRGRGR